MGKAKETEGSRKARPNNLYEELKNSGVWISESGQARVLTELLDLDQEKQANVLGWALYIQRLTKCWTW